jgi:hypothetical protein
MIEKLAKALKREGGGVTKIKKSKKASARVTAPNQDASAAAAEVRWLSTSYAAGD